MKFNIILIILAFFIVSACSSDNWQDYNSALDPIRTGVSETHFSVKYPPGWEIGWSTEGSPYLFNLSSGDINADELAVIFAQYNIGIFPDFFRYPPNVNTLYNMQEDWEVIEEPVAFTINGQDAAKIVYKYGDTNTIMIFAWIVNGDANIMFYALPPVEENIDPLPLLESILDTIHITVEDETTSPRIIPTLSAYDQKVVDNWEPILISEEYMQSLLDEEWELSSLNADSFFWKNDHPGTCKGISSSQRSILNCLHLVTSDVDLSDTEQLLSEDWVIIPSNKSYPHDVAFYGVLDDSMWIIHGYMFIDDELFFVEFDGIQIEEGLPIEQNLTHYVDDYVGEILLYNLAKLTE